jgi:hypothetical protein
MDFSHDLAALMHSQTGISSKDLKDLQNDLCYLEDGLHDMLCDETLASSHQDKVKVLRVTALGASAKVESLTERLHSLVRYHS